MTYARVSFDSRQSDFLFRGYSSGRTFLGGMDLYQGGL
jgi:hypothetical protein